MAKDSRHRYRWDHLNEFQQDGTGQYVYTGKTFVFDGDDDAKKRYLVRSGIGGGLALLFALLPECLPPVPVSESFVTLVPWLCQFIAIFTVLWATVRLIASADEMRSYRRDKTAKVLPTRCAVSAVLSLVTGAAQIGYWAFIGFAGNLPLTLVRVLSSLLNGGVCFFLYRLHKKAAWREKR